MQRPEECVCTICGAKFIGIKCSKYCGPECRKEGARRLAAVKPRKHSARISTAKPKSQTLAEIAKAARAEGLQYGEYVAKYGL